MNFPRFSFLLVTLSLCFFEAFLSALLFSHFPFPFWCRRCCCCRLCCSCIPPPSFAASLLTKQAIRHRYHQLLLLFSSSTFFLFIAFRLSSALHLWGRKKRDIPFLHLFNTPLQPGTVPVDPPVGEKSPLRSAYRLPWVSVVEIAFLLLLVVIVFLPLQCHCHCCRSNK